MSKLDIPDVVAHTTDMDINTDTDWIPAIGFVNRLGYLLCADCAKGDDTIRRTGWDASPICDVCRTTLTAISPRRVYLP